MRCAVHSRLRGCAHFYAHGCACNTAMSTGGPRDRSLSLAIEGRRECTHVCRAGGGHVPRHRFEKLSGPRKCEHMSYGNTIVIITNMSPFRKALAEALITSNGTAIPARETCRRRRPTEGRRHGWCLQEGDEHEQAEGPVLVVGDEDVDHDDAERLLEEERQRALALEPQRPVKRTGNRRRHN